MTTVTISSERTALSWAAGEPIYKSHRQVNRKVTRRHFLKADYESFMIAKKGKQLSEQLARKSVMWHRGYDSEVTFNNYGMIGRWKARKVRESRLEAQLQRKTKPNDIGAELTGTPDKEVWTIRNWAWKIIGGSDPAFTGKDVDVMLSASVDGQLQQYVREQREINRQQAISKAVIRDIVEAGTSPESMHQTMRMLNKMFEPPVAHEDVFEWQELRSITGVYTNRIESPSIYDQPAVYPHVGGTKPDVPKFDLKKSDWYEKVLRQYPLTEDMMWPGDGKGNGVIDAIEPKD